VSLFSVWCSILPFVNCPYCKGREVCIVKLTSVDLRHASHSFYTANTPCLPLPRKRSPDGVTTWLVIAAIWLQLVIAAYYSFIDPKSMKGRVGLVSWPTADGLYLCITPLCLSLQQWWEQYTSTKTETVTFNTKMLGSRPRQWKYCLKTRQVSWDFPSLAFSAVLCITVVYLELSSSILSGSECTQSKKMLQFSFVYF